METLYVVVAADGSTGMRWGGVGKWAFPTGDGPGAWMPAPPNGTGYRLCHWADLRRRVPDLTSMYEDVFVWEAEGRGERTECCGEVVFSQARLVRPVAVWTKAKADAYAADCASSRLLLAEERSRWMRERFFDYLTGGQLAWGKGIRHQSARECATAWLKAYHESKSHRMDALAAAEAAMTKVRLEQADRFLTELEKRDG